jgi:hypothetical protein
MKKNLLLIITLFISLNSLAWGFYAHQRINYYALFLLPPELIRLYKPHIVFISEHAVDPDKRRYAVAEEGPRHYIDINHYREYPFKDLPHSWDKAAEKYSADTLTKYGIVPWWIPTTLQRLTKAFRDKDLIRVLKYSAEIGHYVSDAHVPLHANSNHNGQLTGQQGIHGFWESRIPELFAEANAEQDGWDFVMERAEYIADPPAFAWKMVLQSAAAADTVLLLEKQLSARFPADQKFSFEFRNGLITRQYSRAYSKAYDELLDGMIERRMRQSIWAVASCWYTAWINAGQPDIRLFVNENLPDSEKKELETLNEAWKNGIIRGRECSSN